MKKLMILCFVFGGLVPSLCMAQSTEERLASMESTLKQIDKRIDELRSDMNAHFATLGTRIFAVENRLTTLESRQDSFVRWEVGVLVAIVGVVLTTGVALAMSLGSLKRQMEDFPKQMDDRFERVDEQIRLYNAQFDERSKRIDDRFEQVVEQIRLYNAQFDERFKRIDDRFERINDQFERINERFELVDERFKRMDDRFERIDEQLKCHDEQFAQVNEKLDLLMERLPRMGTSSN